MKYIKKALIILSVIGSIYSKEDNMFKRPDITQKELSDYLILNNENINQIYSESAFISQEDWDKLDLDQLIKKLSRTETKLGCSMLKNLMAIPNISVNGIKNRQLMIKLLHNNEKTRADLNKSLTRLKDLEPDILAIFNPDDNIAEVLKNTVNFNIVDFLNTNNIAFTALTTYMIYGGFKGLYFSLLASSFNSEYDQMQQKDNSWKSFSVKNMFMNALKIPFNRHNPYPNILKNIHDKKEIYEKFITRNKGNFTLGDEYKMIQTKYKNIGIPAQISIALTKLAVKDVSLGLMIFSAIKNLKFYFKFFHQVVNRMGNISKFLKTAKDLYNSRSLLSILTAKQVGITKTDMDNLDSYILNLEKTPSILKIGSAGATYNKLMDNKEQLLPIIKFVGLMDAYSSIEKLLNEKENENQWSLANFLPNEENMERIKTPYIKLTNFWLPLINGNPVANSIDLSTTPNVVFTGPNSCGKSTIMKTIAFNIILAQSWGIVPAEEAIITPFYGIRTYLNITEDLSSEKSAFMKETEKIHDILNYAKKLEQGQFAFFLIDEPYTGTIEIEAAQRVVDFGKKLANNQNSISVIATHLEKPIQLSETGRFKNLHLEIIEENSSFIKTFKLLDGPANWWFQDPAKRQSFVDWLSYNL